MNAAHTHHRSGDTGVPRTLESWMLRIGAVAAATTVTLTLIAFAFAAGDRYGVAPYVRNRALPLIEDYKKEDSARWERNDREHAETNARIRQEFTVLITYQKSTMTPEQIQKANDLLVNDTTVPPELKRP